MDGKQTLIYDPAEMSSKGKKKATPKKFTFDYSYWSHDNFKEDKDGYYQPTNSKYADQVSTRSLNIQNNIATNLIKELI